MKFPIIIRISTFSLIFIRSQTESCFFNLQTTMTLEATLVSIKAIKSMCPNLYRWQLDILCKFSRLYGFANEFCIIGDVVPEREHVTCERGFDLTDIAIAKSEDGLRIYGMNMMHSYDI